MVLATINVVGSFITSMYEGSFWNFLLQNYKIEYYLFYRTIQFFSSVLYLSMFLNHFSSRPFFLASRFSCVVIFSWAIAFIIWSLLVLRISGRKRISNSLYFVNFYPILLGYISCLLCSILLQICGLRTSNKQVNVK